MGSPYPSPRVHAARRRHPSGPASIDAATDRSQNSSRAGMLRDHVAASRRRVDQRFYPGFMGFPQVSAPAGVTRSTLLLSRTVIIVQTGEIPAWFMPDYSRITVAWCFLGFVSPTSLPGCVPCGLCPRQQTAWRFPLFVPGIRYFSNCFCQFCTIKKVRLLTVLHNTVENDRDSRLISLFYWVLRFLGLLSRTVPSLTFRTL